MMIIATSAVGYLSVYDTVNGAIKVVVEGMTNSFTRLAIVFVLGFVLGQMTLTSIYLTVSKYYKQTHDKDIIIHINNTGMDKDQILCLNARTGEIEYDIEI